MAHQGARPNFRKLRRGAAAVWGAPTPPAERPRMRLIKPLNKGALAGFAVVELPIGLRILDVPILVGRNDACWASLPARPQIDPEGRVRRDERGKGRLPQARPGRRR
jgi:hypothetical protein